MTEPHKGEVKAACSHLGRDPGLRAPLGLRGAAGQSQMSVKIQCQGVAR